MDLAEAPFELDSCDIACAATVWASRIPKPLGHGVLAVIGVSPVPGMGDGCTRASAVKRSK